MELREVNQMHVKKFNNLESERSKLIEKIKCLEDKLIESQMQLENFANDKLVQMLKGQKCSSDKTGLGFDKYDASSSNIVSISKTIFCEA
jgi:TolA-binding protein